MPVWAGGRAFREGTLRPFPPPRMEASFLYLSTLPGLSSTFTNTEGPVMWIHVEIVDIPTGCKHGIHKTRFSLASIGCPVRRDHVGGSES